MSNRKRWTAISLLCVTVLAGCSGGTSVVSSSARRPGSTDSFGLDPAANGPQLSVPQRTTADAGTSAGITPPFQAVQTTSTASGAQAFTASIVSEDQFDQNPSAVARLDQTLVMTLENPSQVVAGFRTMAASLPPSCPPPPSPGAPPPSDPPPSGCPPPPSASPPPSESPPPTPTGSPPPSESPPPTPTGSPSPSSSPPPSESPPPTPTGSPPPSQSPRPSESPPPSQSASPSLSPPPSQSAPPSQQPAAGGTPPASASPSGRPSPGAPRPRRLPPELQRRGEVKKTPGERVVRYEVEREETLRFRLELPGEGHRMRMEDAAGQVVFDIGNGETSQPRLLRPGRYRLFFRHSGRGDRLAFFVRRQGDLMVASISCRGCDLHGANLANMDLSGADFGPDRGQTPLVPVNLAGANLANTLLRSAILEEADLSGANLSGADLTAARLAGAKLRDARLDGATFTDGRSCAGGSLGFCN